MVKKASLLTTLMIPVLLGLGALSGCKKEEAKIPQNETVTIIEHPGTSKERIKVIETKDEPVIFQMPWGTSYQKVSLKDLANNYEAYEGKDVAVQVTQDNTITQGAYKSGIWYRISNESREQLDRISYDFKQLSIGVYEDGHSIGGTLNLGARNSYFGAKLPKEGKINGTVNKLESILMKRGKLPEGTTSTMYGSFHRDEGIKMGKLFIQAIDVGKHRIKRGHSEDYTLTFTDLK